MPSPFVKISWNKHETALLIDAYKKVSSGEAVRKDIVASLSSRLRYGMTINGIEINDRYRNENGIMLQMSAIEYLLTEGNKGIANGSHVFAEMVELSKADNIAFNKILAEAKEKYPLPSDNYTCMEMAKSGVNIAGEENPHDILLLKDIKKVLSTKFSKGMRINSSIDIRRFRVYFEEAYGKVCNLTEIDLQRIIKECGMENEGKIFVPENLLPEDLQKEVNDFVENTFSTHRNYMFYECLFAHFSNKLLYTPVANVLILRAYLEYKYKNQFYFSKDYMAIDANVDIEVDDEVIGYVRDQWQIVSEDDVVHALYYLPENAVRNAFGRNQTILIAACEGMRFHIDKFEVSNAELRKISDIIDSVINESQFISGDELLKYVRQNVPNVINNNSDIPELGIRKALAVRLADRFSFNNSVISRKGERLSARDALLAFAKSHAKYTLQEIDELAKSLGTVLNYYLETLLEYSVRINASLFVAKANVHFDVEVIDHVLEQQFDKDMLYCPLRDISNFTAMPECGYPWTQRLLESYLKAESHKFTLYTSDYLNKNSVCGVVAPKSETTTFEDIIVSLLAQGNIKLEKKEVLEYLVSEGCIVQRRYANIESVIKKAQLLRDRDSINKTI